MTEPSQQPTGVATAREMLALVRSQTATLASIVAAGLLLLAVSTRLTPIEAALSVVLLLALAALAVIDRDQFRLPDVITLPLVGVGIAFVPPQTVLGALERTGAALAAYLLLFVIAEGYRRWRGHAGLGLGDAKLFAAAGAWVTAWGLPSVLLIAATMALAVTLIVAYRQAAPLSRTARIAFGPYLALGLWIVWLFGPLL